MRTKVLNVLQSIILPIILIIVLFTSCDGYEIDGNPHKLKYRVTYGFGNTKIYDASTGEIEYMDGGRIKYESFNNGLPDTVIVGGRYLIENYR